MSAPLCGRHRNLCSRVDTLGGMGRPRRGEGYASAPLVRAARSAAAATILEVASAADVPHGALLNTLRAIPGRGPCAAAAARLLAAGSAPAAAALASGACPRPHLRAAAMRSLLPGPGWGSAARRKPRAVAEPRTAAVWEARKVTLRPPRRVTAEAAGSYDPVCRDAAAEQHDCPPAVLARLAEQDNPNRSWLIGQGDPQQETSVNPAIIDNTATPKSALASLYARHDHWAVRGSVQARPDCPAALTA